MWIGKSQKFWKNMWPTPQTGEKMSFFPFFLWHSHSLALALNIKGRSCSSSPSEPPTCTGTSLWSLPAWGHWWQPPTIESTRQAKLVTTQLCVAPACLRPLVPASNYYYYYHYHHYYSHYYYCYYHHYYSHYYYYYYHHYYYYFKRHFLSAWYFLCRAANAARLVLWLNLGLLFYIYI